MANAVFGKLPSGTVGEMLLKVWDLLDTSSVAVIRSIDSARSLDDLRRTLSFHEVPCYINAGNVCVDMRDLSPAVATGVFTGFDELWLFRNRELTAELVDVPGVTSDGIDLSQGIPKPLSEVIERSHCVLVLADGCGLNYVTSDDRVAQTIASIDG